MPTCDQEIYNPPEDPTPPASRTLAGSPAANICKDILICNENGIGLPSDLQYVGTGDGNQSSLKISRSGASIRGGYREIGGGVVFGPNLLFAEDLGIYPKTQYINNSEIVFDLDSANIFNLKITRLDRLYTILLKSVYHRRSSDGARSCVGYVKTTSFGDTYIFVDGTTDLELTSLPAGRAFEIDEIPNVGKFIFELSPVLGKPQTDSKRVIYISIEYTGSESGDLLLSFDEFFDFQSLGGGNPVVDSFVFQKPMGFVDVIKQEGALTIEAESFNYYEVKIGNPTMYVIDEDDFDPSCVSNYNSVVHNRYSKNITLTKLF